MGSKLWVISFDIDNFYFFVFSYLVLCRFFIYYLFVFTLVLVEILDPRDYIMSLTYHSWCVFVVDT